MKALEILTYMKASYNDEEVSEKFEEMSEDELKTYLDECIAELEALQQPKSCDDCRSKSCSIKRILLERVEINSSYFYCNDFEPEEK